MKQAMFRRLGALEARQLTAVRLEDQRSERMVAIHWAMATGFALRVGIRAQEDLAAADASLDPGRREQLEQQAAAARRIAATLAKYSPAKQVETGEPAWR